jgi:sarcosine oxidase subunit alpha
VSEAAPVPHAHQPRERLWVLETEKLVIAAGAHERPIAFAGNDKPGVMLASAARAYVNRFAVKPGLRAVVFGNNADIHTTALDLQAAGVEVAAVVDGRPEAGAARGDYRVVHGRIAGVGGGQHVRHVDLTNGERVHCDLVCMAGGWNPAVHLSSQGGAKPVWDEAVQAFVPGRPRQGEVSVGAAAGEFATAQALIDGARAGVEAAKACGYPDAAPPDSPMVGEAVIDTPTPLWSVPGHDKTAFIDPQNDVTVADVKLAAREGYSNVEHMKRYTTLGMATDQGKVANVVGLGILAELRGQPMGEIGTTTFRPPYTPVSIGSLAGYNRQQTFLPVRRTPLHDWQARHGAVFVEAGPWMRARYFPREGEAMGPAANREVATVRGAVGVCDVSTLGRIDIQGPDAAELLNRVYINGWSKLPVGKARYGVMLREDGIVLDDGTTSRLGEQHYLMTATTAQAAKVMTHLEFCLQVLWPGLDVNVMSVTDQWAGLAVAGPQARTLMQRLLPAEDLSNAAFPFMACGTFALDGIPLRLFRISFSGELGYEVNVPAAYGPAVGERLLELGGDLGVALYGLEALDIMRIEKGHVTAQELDGRVTAQDLGMARMLSGKKDYIGRRLSQRPAFLEDQRPRLVGLRSCTATEKALAGSHLLPEGAAETPENDLGWISSATWSPTLSRYIALAFVAGGAGRKGETLRAVDFVRGRDVRVEVVDSVFVDPEGARQRG